MGLTRRHLLRTTLPVAAGAAGCSELTDDPAADATPVEADTVRLPDEWVFDPEVIEVPVGTTVTWMNEGSHEHTVTFRDDEPVDFDEELGPGESVTHTFEQTGEFDYYCRFHQPDMVGKVIVTDG
jgi:plastocyanin